jgi:hypothetical protein
VWQAIVAQQWTSYLDFLRQIEFGGSYLAPKEAHYTSAQAGWRDMVGDNLTLAR